MNDATFFASIRASLFNGTFTQSQVDGINVLLAAGASLIAPQLAYLLATAFHETARTIQPIAEYGHGAGHDYGKVDISGKAPYGRGFVQLTSRANYVKADAELALGGKLAANYDFALDPTIAAKIIVRGMSEGWFTDKKLNDYIALDHHDFYDARRIVNGLDKAQMIADYAEHFLSALVAAYAPASTIPIPNNSVPLPTKTPVIVTTPAKPAPPPIPAQPNLLEKLRMNLSLFSIILKFLPDISALEQDVAAEVKVIASTEGGAAKVQQSIVIIEDMLARIKAALAS